MGEHYRKLKLFEELVLQTVLRCKYAAKEMLHCMLILLSNLIRQHFGTFNKTSYLAGVQKSSWLVFGPASNSSLNGFSKEYVLMFHPEKQSVSVKKFTGQHKKFMTQWSEVMTLG